MAFSAGDFTSAALYSEILTRYNRLWKTDGVHNQFKKGIPIFNALTSRQSVEFADEDFLDPAKCQDLKIRWLQDDETDPSDIADMDAATDFCDFDGAEIGSDSATYSPDLPFEYKFKIEENRCKDEFDFAEKAAFAIMSAEHKCTRYLEKRYIAALQGFGDDLSGITLPVGAVDVGDDTIWEIPVADVNNTLLAQLEILQEDSFMSNPLWITGAEVYRLAQKVQAAENPMVSRNDSLLLDSSFVRNIRDLDSIIGSPSMFVVDASQVAYFNQFRYKNNVPKDEKVSERLETFHMDSRLASWSYGGTSNKVKFDVRWKRKCLGTDNYALVGAIRHQGGIIKAPKGEDAQPTVMQIKQVA